MARKVPIDRLTEACSKILAEYGENVQENVADIVKALSKEGAKTVKANARADFGGTGKYASGWKSRFDNGRLSAQGIIYNEKVPGLPHLLEHGHANRGGGRTPGTVHIAPVEEELVKQFEREVKSKL